MNTFKAQTDLLKSLSHSTRLAILYILREGEQCVCHMEATLGLRQAYISQQLMVLKQAGLVESRRDGLNLFYRVVRPEIFGVLDSISSVVGFSPSMPRHRHINVSCPCPKCSQAGNQIIKIALPQGSK